ncbi:MAG: hypothetical protein QOE77_3302 [Blastocatellia bacterium]|nr:hypothetical protein [Blastocatellia bacterium]
MKLNLNKTPDKLTVAIIDGCGQLVPGGKPVFVRRHAAPGALVNKCTLNVRQYLVDHPGTMLLGWDVAVWDHVLLDCIGHAVVETDGDILCVSPSKYGETSLLFVPDERIRFDFDNPMARMPSKQIALTHKPEVQRFIDIAATESAIKIKYPVSAGQIAIRGEDAINLQELAREKQPLLLRILLSTTSPGGACFCGSGKKFRTCCKTNLERTVSGSSSL